MISRNLTLVSQPLLALACAPVERTTDTNPAGGPSAVKVVGEAQRCIMRDQIRQTAVHNYRMIDSEMNGGKVLRCTMVKAVRV